MSENNLDLELIAKDCGILSSATIEDVILKIDNLENCYTENQLIEIYNYLLGKAQNPRLIMHLICKIDEYRDSSSLEVLVDILLLRKAPDNTDNTSGENLKEDFVKTRVMCTKAIANLKKTEAVNSLLYCLNNKNENYRVRLACADALGKIGDRFAVAPLIEVMQDEDEKSVYLRESAVSALGLLGDYRAIDPFVNILETKQGIMNKFSFLKERVIEALNKMGISNDEKVFRALKHSLTDESPQVRIDAIEGIMNSDNPQSYQIIKKCLEQDEDEEVKKNALIALYNLSDRSILDEVINCEKYSDKLKMAAVEILEEYENDGNEDEDIDENRSTNEEGQND